MIFSLISWENSNVIFSNRSPLKSESSEESDANEKLRQTSRKRKKEKKKKRKHQHHKKTRRRRGQPGSSASESDAGSEKDKPSRGLRDGRRESERPRYVSALGTCGVLQRAFSFPPSLAAAG